MKQNIPFAFLFLTGFCNAFVGQTTTKFLVKNNPPSFMSSYDVDSDEDAEQRLGESNGERVKIETVEIPNFPVNGNSQTGRYGDVLASIGLGDKLKHAGMLPEERVVSSFDIFCNRELNQAAITAIGFDMVSEVYL